MRFGEERGDGERNVLKREGGGVSRRRETLLAPIRNQSELDKNSTKILSTAEK